MSRYLDSEKLITRVKFRKQIKRTSNIEKLETFIVTKREKT